MEPVMNTTPSMPLTECDNFKKKSITAEHVGMIDSDIKEITLTTSLRFYFGAYENGAVNENGL